MTAHAPRKRSIIVICRPKASFTTQSRHNNVFVGLCYAASPLGPAASFCVDLTTGKTSVLPDYTDDVIWTSKPTSDGGRCNLRGVLKITPPKWAQSVSYHMAFERPTRYSFNIGDSLTNNAWGKNKQHSLSVRYVNGFPFDNPELRIVNLHVLRPCASSIFTLYSFLRHVFSYNITPPQFRSSVFRYPPTSIFRVLINRPTSCSAFLFTWPYHLSLASFIFSPMFATPVLLLFRHS